MTRILGGVCVDRVECMLSPALRDKVRRSMGGVCINVGSLFQIYIFFLIMVIFEA